jgi:hypothetical protein
VKQAKFPVVLVSPEQKSNKKQVMATPCSAVSLSNPVWWSFISQKYIFERLTAFKTRL